jgi:hypothetical protein
MTAPEEPVDGPVDPDEIAEEAPIDPTPQEVDEYRTLIGDPIPEPDESGDDGLPVESGEGGEGGEEGEPEVPQS